jgi:hypothetical protein
MKCLFVAVKRHEQRHFMIKEYSKCGFWCFWRLYLLQLYLSLSTLLLGDRVIDQQTRMGFLGLSSTEGIMESSLHFVV